MVSKSKTLGKSPIILITVGTTLFPFTRLLKAIDHSLLSIPYNPFVIVQSFIDYEWKYPNVKLYKDVSPPEIITLIQNASRIICHGGIGTMHTISQCNKKTMPLIVARKARYQEHVDDHQVKFLEFLKNKVPTDYHHNLLTHNSFEKRINEYLMEEPQSNILSHTLFPRSDHNQLVNKLNSYIQRSHENTINT